MQQRRSKFIVPCLVSALLLLAPTGADAAPDDVKVEVIGGRDALVFVPAVLPARGQRALVMVLHGGLGNAQRIAARTAEGGLNMNAVAATDGFVAAYLNGTPVTRRLGADKLGWNAGGGCCGLSAENRIDDVAYLTKAIDALVVAYGIDRERVYAMGHSNGAMMAQRLLCETGLLAAAVRVSGPLNLDIDACPAARGRRVLAIHGADDRNVPVDGGRGTAGISGATFRSQADSRRAFVGGGATYTLLMVEGADHRFDRLDAMVRQTEGVSIAEKAARFFGLTDVTLRP